MSNWGEWSNPDDRTATEPFDSRSAAIYAELEYPGGSQTVFLYSGGLWVGALKNGVPIVSTCTDGDNGTAEYGPDQYWHFASRDSSAKEVDDDGDWDSASDDLNADGEASFDFDGVPDRDDDGDGATDEETLNGVDDDGDGLVDEDVGAVDAGYAASGQPWLNDDASRITAGDANGDGNPGYDPEPGIDEDPEGDMSADFLDNDADGLIDEDDPDLDGDTLPGDDDDDGDGVADEDQLGRAGQEWTTVYSDIYPSWLDSEDGDGFTPLGVRVVQHSYQWSENFADDFILFDYLVTNIGDDVLEEICLGTFFDFDAGHMTQSGNRRSEDDATYYIDSLQIAVGGDPDGDDGLLEAQWFGVKVVQTPMPDVQTTYKNFERLSGGDPVDNQAKYALMSSGERDPDGLDEGDWRFVMAFGPLGDLHPGETLPVTIAVVNGADVDAIARNARQAQGMFEADFRGPSSPSAPEFSLEGGDREVRIVWEFAPDAVYDGFVGRNDFEGFNVWKTTDGFNFTLVASYDTPDNGIGYDVGWPEDMYEDPDVPGLYHYACWDRGLPNGFPILYAVTAFDDGDNGDGFQHPAIDEQLGMIGVLESSRGGDQQQSVVPAKPVAGDGDLDGVFVVPNPFIGGSRLEQVPAWVGATRTYPKVIEFRGLPGECTIRIYTLAGDHVETIEHDSGASWEKWDLRTTLDQEIAGGTYFYVVESGGTETVGKFVVVK
jgi:hypothetical protein